MAVTLTSGAPELIEQGGTYIFEEQLSDFPHTDWTAQYLLQIAGSASYTTNATNGTGNNNFVFTLNRADTANWTPGRYTFSIYATEMSSNQRATAKTGVMNVIPDLSQTQTASTAQEMLDNINTAITQLTTGGFQSVSVNNVSYTRYDVTTLIAMRTRLQAEVIREQQAQEVLRGINHTGIIGTRFK
jgi:hypothetical protein